MLKDSQATLGARGEGGGSRHISLRQVTDLSVGKSATENAIIQGDNALVLDLLKPRYEGKVRCAYIDPPDPNQERDTH